MERRKMHALGRGSPSSGLKIGRRRLLGVCGVGAVAFSTACGSARRSPGSVASSNAPADESSLTPQRGGQFQMIGYRQLEHLNAWKVVNANNTFYFEGGVYNALLTYEYKPWQDWRGRKLVSALAESWEQPDNTTYTFHLRRNVKWHDATPFMAANVKWAYEFMADPTNKLAAATYLRNMVSVSAPDDYTIQIKTKLPDVSFLRGLQGDTVILPRHVHDRGDPFEKVAIGTGPFKIDAYDPEKGVVYSPNKNYWQQGRPYLDRWKILAPADEAGRLAAFTAGQNDVLHLTNKRQVDTVLALVKGAKTFTFQREVTGDMYLKLDKPPFNDKRIRQAVQMGIDRGEMIKTLDSGDGLMNPPGINAVAKGWTLPQSELEKLPGWRNPKEQDLQEAKQLLQQAGYANGGVSFTIAVDQALDYVGADATVIAGQLRKLGITVNIQPLESVVYTRNFTAGDYQAVIDATGTSSPGDGFWQARFHSGGFFNKMPVNDPEVDRLIDAQTQEFDEAKRQALFLQIERLLAREVYVVPLTADPGYFVGHPYIHGWIDNVALNCRNMDWSQLWFDQGLAPKGRTT